MPYALKQVLDGGGVGNFGNAVAMSSDGSTIIVGAPFEGDPGVLAPGEDGDDPVGHGIGAVYVYVLSGDEWVLQHKIDPDDYIKGPLFGRSVALSDDGNTAAIAGPFDAAFEAIVDGEGHPELSDGNGGAVWIYVRDEDGEWSMQAKIPRLGISVSTSGDPGPEDFGHCVDLSDDGNTFIAVSSGANDPNFAAGYAILGQREDGEWSTDRLLPGDPHTTTRPPPFGETGPNIQSCSVSGDGNTVVFGGPVTDEGNGYFFTFVRTDGGWVESGVGGITANSTPGFICGDPGGVIARGLSLSYDGCTVYVAAADQASPGGFIFTRETDTDWNLFQAIDFSDQGDYSLMEFTPAAEFGILATPFDDGGHLYIARLREDMTEWDVEDTIVGDAGVLFGWSAAVTTNERIVVVGSPTSGGGSGLAFIYALRVLAVSFDGIEYAG